MSAATHVRAIRSFQLPFKFPPIYTHPNTLTIIYSPSTIPRFSLQSRNVPTMVLCNCGKTTIILTSWTDRNPGRRFYSCPDQNSRCGFVGWYDRKCQRCADIISGLLRVRDNLEVGNERLVGKLKASESDAMKLKKLLIVNWIGFILYLLLVQGADK